MMRLHNQLAVDQQNDLDVDNLQNRLSDGNENRLTLLPLDYVLGDDDVICGRGRKCLIHKGNIRFLNLVRQNLSKYTEAKTKLDKSLIIINVIEEIRRASPNGGFVKSDPLLGRYYRVSENAAREKTSQAFRDALYYMYKSSNESRKKKRSGAPVRSASKTRKDSCFTQFKRNTITCEFDPLYSVWSQENEFISPRPFESEFEMKAQETICFHNKQTSFEDDQLYQKPLTEFDCGGFLVRYSEPNVDCTGLAVNKTKNDLDETPMFCNEKLIQSLPLHDISLSHSFSIAESFDEGTSFIQSKRNQGRNCPQHESQRRSNIAKEGDFDLFDKLLLATEHRFTNDNPFEPIPIF